MPLTPDQLKAQILTDVADDGTVAAQLNSLWLKNDGKPLWSQYLYTKLDAVNALLARNRGLINVIEDTQKIDLQGIITNLQVLQLAVQAEIALEEGRSVDPCLAVGDMDTTAPEMVALGRLDPNSGVYRGDPLAWTPRRVR